MDDVGGGVAVVSADPLVDEDAVVEEAEPDQQLAPREGVLVPVRVEHGPAAQVAQQRLERRVAALGDQRCDNKPGRHATFTQQVVSEREMFACKALVNQVLVCDGRPSCCVTMWPFGKAFVKFNVLMLRHEA